MGRNLMWVAKLEVTERHVLELLRQAWAASGQEAFANNGAEAAGLLAAMAHALRDCALDVRKPAAQLASIDEVWLLGALALAQRSRMRARIGGAFPYQAALDLCGTRLLALGIPLPFAAVGRHLPTVHGTKTPAHEPASTNGERTSPAMASPRVRAMRLLQSQETVSAKQFVANGVPYKLLGELCKLGVMRRQARGMYVRVP